MSNIPSTIDRQLDEFISQPSSAVVQALSEVPGDFAVLGAGGKMGFHTARMLQRAIAELGRSSRIMAVSRFGSAEAREPFERAGIEIHRADLTSPEEVSSLPDVENVVYLAGMKFGTANNPDLLEEMNVRMPRRIAERYRDSRIVALSTGNVYSYTTPRSGGPDETGETNPPGSYGQSCLRKEQGFCDVSREHGTRCVIVRLNYAIALRYGVLTDIAQKVLAGEPVNLETGYANVIWQGDAIAHVLQSFAYAASPPLLLNVTGPEILSIRQLALRFGELMDREVKLEGQESETALLSNAAKSHRLLGSPQVSIDQMVEWTADWLLQGGTTLGKPTHFEVRTGTY